MMSLANVILIKIILKRKDELATPGRAVSPQPERFLKMTKIFVIYTENKNMHTMPAVTAFPRPLCLVASSGGPLLSSLSSDSSRAERRGAMERTQSPRALLRVSISLNANSHQKLFLTPSGFSVPLPGVFFPGSLQ